MTWPIIEGTSLLHLHTHRGKKSVALNLKARRAGRSTRTRRHRDVVFRPKPGALAGFGLGYDVLKEINPSIVFATLSGWLHGPYRDMPSHGIAYDTWAGIVQPVTDDDGFTRIPKDMPGVGINDKPMVPR